MIAITLFIFGVVGSIWAYYKYRECTRERNSIRVAADEDEELHVERSVAVNPDPSLHTLPMSIAIVSMDSADNSMRDLNATDDDKIKELKSS